MKDTDKKEFAMLMTGTAEMFSKPMGKAQLQMYFIALGELTIDQVREGLNKHIRNPDGGQFMPRPADIIKQVHGSQADANANLESAAQMQWMNVTRAIAQVGSYRTPKFKDPVTAAVICSLGNWASLCNKTEEQLKWVGKEFTQLYQTYHKKNLTELPQHVAGREEMQKMSQSTGSIMKSLEDGLQEHFGKGEKQ